MKLNKIGILELRNDPFITDVVSKLGDLPVEFLSFADRAVPVTSDYKVVVDRMSFCLPYLKEMVKNMSLDGTYVINNPFTASVDNKLVDAGICQFLGISFPKSIVLPDPVVRDKVSDMVREPSWDRIADEVGFPCILKPIDGYAWEDVYEVNTPAELKGRYAMGSGKTWLVQQKVHYEEYYRIFCIDQKDVLFVKWIPRPFGLGEYLYTDSTDIDGTRAKLAEQIIRLNSALDMDANVVEWCTDNKGQSWVIDAFNEVPDVPKDRIPTEHYWWIVDRFTACIRDKLDLDKRNRTAFKLASAQQCTS